MHIQDLAELDVQRKERRKKEKIAADIGIKRSQGKLIHSTYRHQQYKSTACIKGNPRKVDQMLARLSTPTAKRRFLRAQIEMRVDGLGGEFADLFRITWSHQRELRTIKFLSDHLKKIVVAEVSMAIPTKPPTYLPQRRPVPIVGTLTSEVREMDRKHFTDVAKLREDTEALRLQMEERGEGSLYSMLQPDIVPTVDELVQKKERVDVLCSIEVQVGATEVLRWCQGQGKVTKKLKGKMLRGKEVPTVMIEWDGMPDVGGWEEGGFEPKELKDHLFNRDKEGAWRLDVALAPVDEDEDNVSDNDGESLDSDSADNGNDSSSDNGSEVSISTDSNSSDSGESNGDSDDEESGNE